VDNHGKETVPEIEGEGYGGSRGIGEKGLVSVFFGNGLFGVNGMIMMFFKRLIIMVNASTRNENSRVDLPARDCRIIMFRHSHEYHTSAMCFMC